VRAAPKPIPTKVAALVYSGASEPNSSPGVARRGDVIAAIGSFAEPGAPPTKHPKSRSLPGALCQRRANEYQSPSRPAHRSTPHARHRESPRPIPRSRPMVRPHLTRTAKLLGNVRSRGRSQDVPETDPVTNAHRERSADLARRLHRRDWGPISSRTRSVVDRKRIPRQHQSPCASYPGAPGGAIDQCCRHR